MAGPDDRDEHGHSKRDRFAAIAGGFPGSFCQMNQDTHQATILTPLSDADWASFGLEHMAYTRSVLVDGVKAIAIHSADGTAIGAAPSLDLAKAAIIQNDMEPLALH